MPKKYSEQEIIEGCKKQDKTFQEYLYKKSYGLFFKVCSRYAKDMEDAEQLTHDGFIKVFKNMNQFEGKGSFEGWMRRIMVNTCLDYLKSKQIKEENKTVLADEIIENNHFNITNNALDNIALKELIELIQTLPTMSKTVFNLFIIDGYPHKDISKMLNISEGTSQWHVNNARKILKKRILHNEQTKIVKK